MAFRSIQEDNHDDYEVKPWAEEYVTENPTKLGQVFQVEKIKIRPKGLIFETACFSAFVFKSSLTYKEVVQYVESIALISKKKPGSKSPVDTPAVRLTSKRPFIEYGLDDETTCQIVLLTPQSEPAVYMIQPTRNDLTS